MIGVRLAGRGGQGIKSAAHVVGTAAFLAGRHVQDQPLYGAERRGAPVTAFIRISDKPVLDRGPVHEPALLVIADESLLDDRSFDALEGTTGNTAVFVNTSKSAGHVASTYGVAGRLITADLSRMAEEALEKPVVSAAVAGATGRLLGLDWSDIEQALVLELKDIRVEGEEQERNLELAKKAYGSFAPLEKVEGGAQVVEQTFIELAYHGPEASTCSVVSPGNTRGRDVGAWSRLKPVINYDECTRCRICFVYCPDSAITIGSDDFPVIDYNACKGCDICYTECPVKAISLVRREK
ncbi:2-oxoacid:acceptor oxidoreductase family protein [Nitrososphaera sp.]|uniref:2-oxoacid:acceptor oxidoreductase family protein n=1 Tax=Nitrososphaera sp. TaxID=1971748 RepID=UPI0017DEE34E|nr:2-oxoacid:acceptor oxidoreductase family protein [Nitrososphaera sp.]NWG37741.1 2-oxoacid:acceptor oxidoreductase family protein [Nitrososphaera sp.]